ncbi:MAG: leucine-rich repeat domain-containing protein, partial [Treponemataceae bacterium]
KVTEKPEAQQPTDESIFKTEEVDGKPSLCKITGYNVDKDKLPSKLVIPDTIGGKKVTEIGRRAFEGCTGIETLDLSGCTSLKKIVESAFRDCIGITTLDLSGCTELTQIGWHAFYGCTGIEILTIGNANLTIDENAFANCNNINKLTILKGKITSDFTNSCNKEQLKTLVLGGGVTEIGSSAFEGCTGIETLDLSGCTSLKKIVESAFRDCIGITTLDLSGCIELTQIGWSAFSSCTGITTLNLPASLTKISRSAFSGCTLLETVTFGKTDGWKAYGDLEYKDEIGSIDLSSNELRVNALTKPRSEGGYRNCYWKRN